VLEPLLIGLVGLIIVALGVVTPTFFWRLVMAALRSLDAHFLRSLLATVGVLIGVGSVVACMSILEGATGQILRDLRSLGSNIMFVSPVTAYVHGRPVGAAQTLVMDDVQTLQRELAGEIDAISAEAVGQASIKYFQKSEAYTLIATTDKYFKIHDIEMQHGRAISPAESSDEMALVVCLGAKVAEKLFGGMDPAGQTVKVQNAAYRVIGVLEKRGNVGFINADETVYIPIAAGLKRFFNRRWLNWLTVQVKDRETIEETQKNVATVLRRAHHIRVGQKDDFKIFTQEEVVRQVSQYTIIFKVVFYSIAGISLVVGGIGIMNIMLVSVTERTREIGVRMAVGARRGDILLQFLVEAVIISLLGGGCGLLLGVMFADLLDKVLQGMFRTEITAGVVLTAIATTSIVGIMSGLYPAFKASRLDPVEALRYE
jgi:putative ABC transport system permease protein